VLLDDQCTSERHHHQHAEDAAGEGEHRDLQVIEIAGALRHQEDERRDGEHDAAGHGLAGRPDGLDDVVFEDRRTAELLQYGNGQDGDGNRCGNGQPGAQAEIDRRGAEDDTEQRTDQDRLDGEFRRRLCRRNVWLECPGMRRFGRICGQLGHRARW
jgi:hypothetical protein